MTASERNSGPDRLLLAWATLMAVVLLAPPALLPGLGAASETGIDKVAHFALFLVLALLAVRSSRARSGHPLLLAALGSIAYGIVIEGLQSLTGGRTAELGDLMANGLGSCAGVLVPALLRRS